MDVQYSIRQEVLLSLLRHADRRAEAPVLKVATTIIQDRDIELHELQQTR